MKKNNTILGIIKKAHRQSDSAVIRGDKIYVGDIVISRHYGEPVQVSLLGRNIEMDDELTQKISDLISRVDKIYARRLRLRVKIQKFSDKITKNKHTENMSDDEFTIRTVLEKISRIARNESDCLFVRDEKLVNMLRAATQKVIITKRGGMYQFYLGCFMFGHIPDTSADFPFVIAISEKQFVISNKCNKDLLSYAQTVFSEIYTRRTIPLINLTRNRNEHVR